MKPYKFTPNTTHRFIRVDVDEDLNLEDDMYLTIADIEGLSHEIVTEIIPANFDMITDFNSFVVLNIKIKHDQTLFGKEIYFPPIGIIMRPLKARENIDMVDWIGAFFTEETTEKILNTTEEDRGYLVSDLVRLKDRYAWLWTFKQEEIRKFL